MASEQSRPVLTGLVALVAVAAAVGVFLGLAALGAARVLGVGGDASTGSTTAQQSMYLPKPSDTTSPSGPLITLPAAPGGEGEASSDASAEATESEKPKKRKEISLSAGQTAVAPMEQIDLSGVYPGGEGQVVQVQILESGSWTDFASVDAVVSGEAFTTWIESGRLGEQRFRVVDTETGKTSNPVRVTIG